MKQTFLAASLALGLACAAAPALAQDLVRIDQSGTGSQIAINQLGTAGDNVVGVTQNSTNGTINVSQFGVSGSHIAIADLGNSNQYEVSQFEGQKLRADVDSGGTGTGERNYVRIEQSGFDAGATVENGFSTDSRASIFQWSQGGVGASISQSGQANMATISQGGANLTAMISQSGTSNSATINQGISGRTN
jgi:hypothetical protein